MNKYGKLITGWVTVDFVDMTLDPRTVHIYYNVIDVSFASVVLKFTFHSALTTTFLSARRRS